MTAEEDNVELTGEPPASSDVDGTDPDETSSLRGFIDIGSAAVITLLGLAGLIGGPLLTQFADEAWIQEAIEAEEQAMEGVDEAELVDLLVTGIWWGGIGVTVAAIVLIGVGILFGWRRYDAYRAVPARSASSIDNGIVAAVASFVLSFIPFSPVLGGAIGGYLEGADYWGGAKVGVLAGIFLTIPTAIISLVLIIGLTLNGFVLFGALILASVVIGLVVSVFFCAIGGFVGGYLVDNDRQANRH